MEIISPYSRLVQSEQRSEYRNVQQIHLNTTESYIKGLEVIKFMEVLEDCWTSTVQTICVVRDRAGSVIQYY